MTGRYKEQADIFVLLKCHRNIDRSPDKVNADGMFLIPPCSSRLGWRNIISTFLYLSQDVDGSSRAVGLASWVN